MKKSVKSEKALKSIHEIHNDLLGNDSLSCMFAVRYCVLNMIVDKETIDILIKLKRSPLIEWNSCKISNCALAALQLLEIEPYNGEDEQVLELIETVFYTIV